MFTLSQVISWLVQHGAPAPRIETKVDITPAGTIINHTLTFVKPGFDDSEVPWYVDNQNRVVFTEANILVDPPRVLVELQKRGLAQGNPYVLEPFPPPVPIAPLPVLPPGNETQITLTAPSAPTGPAAPPAPSAPAPVVKRKHTKKK